MDAEDEKRIRYVTLPTRDANRRELFRRLLGLTKKEANRSTVEQLEDRCLEKGYLSLVNPAAREQKTLKEGS